MSTSVKRACDACHRRKVKCDGISPCRNCSNTQLSCTYHAIPQKKGPKGSRAKVISELRETQRQATLSKVSNRINDLIPSLAPTLGLLTTDMIKECLDFFFVHMYPSLPVLHRERIEQQIPFVDQNLDTYCLLTSLCAFMMIQPGMGIQCDLIGIVDSSLPSANLVLGNLLMQETLRVRKSYNYFEAPTLNSLTTNFFLFGCYFGLDLHNNAWFYLREATTLAHMNGLQKEETYLQFDATDASRRRRLFWLLFVSERAYALQRHHPLSLQATINPPTQDDDPSDPQACYLNGFIDLVNLFRPFDESFVTLWNKTRIECSANYLAGLQRGLTSVLPTHLNSTDIQNVDLRTSQQWLRTMVWQLSMQNGCLSSTHEEPSMTFQYPVDIARDLVSLTFQFSHQSMDAHGIGFIKKLFDIACSLTDVLSLLPSHSESISFGPRDYLQDLIGLLAVLRHGDHQFLPLLLAKVNDVLPQLLNPILQTVPDTPSDATKYNTCHEIDTYEDLGNTLISTTSQFPGYHGSDNADFKLKPHDNGARGIHGYSVLEKLNVEEISLPLSPIVNNSSESENGVVSASYKIDDLSPIEYGCTLSDVGIRHNKPQGENSPGINYSKKIKNHDPKNDKGDQTNHHMIDNSTRRTTRRPPIRSWSGSSVVSTATTTSSTSSSSSCGCGSSTIETGTGIGNDNDNDNGNGNGGYIFSTTQIPRSVPSPLPLEKVYSSHHRPQSVTSNSKQLMPNIR